MGDWPADPAADGHRPPRVVVAVVMAALVAGGVFLATRATGGQHGGDQLRVGVGEQAPPLAEERCPSEPPPQRGGAPPAVPPPDVDILQGRWRQLPDPPSERDSPSMNSAGKRVLVWGGACGHHTPDGLAYDPEADAWTRLADAPIAGRQGHVSAWTGQELLVWGGNDADALDDGAAYDPAQQQWRRLPDAPLDQGHAPGGTWTGEELVVITGGAQAQAAAYDPRRDRWRLLADPPMKGHRYKPVWTGSEVVMVTDASHGSVARYDPTRDVWRAGSDRSEAMPSYGVDVAWSGEEVLTWGGQADVPSRRGWAYNPRSDSWRRLPDAWLDGRLTEDASAWTGTHWIMVGEQDGLPTLAAYDPAGDRWLALPPPPGEPLLGGPLAWTGEELIVWPTRGGAAAFRPEVSPRN